ncbi:Protein kinase domain containing protein, partial [Reticulomyxa filosa]
ITDFGLAKSYGVLSEGTTHYLETTCGTPGYVAPEILKQKNYREPVDMWSLGVIVYILLCGFPPFGGTQNIKAMYRKIKKGEFSFPSPAWDGISLLAKDCIRSLLTVDPKRRLRADELCEHPWIKSHHLQSPLNIADQKYSRNLQLYTYRKRLRRGVELIITLNRMIRAAGLEEVAKRQREQFRKRLLPYKQKLKSEQKLLKAALENNDYDTANTLKHVEFYPYDDTPPIDYRK